VAGVIASMALWAPPLVFVDLPAGGRVVSYQEGALAAVSVVEDAAGVSRLRIDNRQQEGSSASLLSDARQALLPLLLHPAPKRVLFLGLGTGMTAASAAEDPTLQVDAAELLPEVIAASAHFTQAFGAGVPNPRLHLIAADARRAIRAGGPRYEVIISDNFHPARSGSGSLYTVEHFRAVQGRLSDDGLFCQWLPLHQLDLGTLRSIVQAYLAVYPGAWAILATNSLDTPVLGLVARNDGGRFDQNQVRKRLASNALPQQLADFGLADEFALLGGFIAGPQALSRFAGDAPLNTDDLPIVAYQAPRITYAADSLPRDRLLSVLAQLGIEPSDLMASGADAPWQSRLAQYWAARDRFIAAGRDVRPSPQVQDMLAQVREPLLSVLRISPDFRPAYDPLLRMAVVLGRSDVLGASALLSALMQAQPLRPEAEQALRQLASP
jgi:spermidine synthase